jgi:hypothetical protein
VGRRGLVIDKRFGGRRSTMQVAGKNQVAYTWDNANRLNGIMQGPSRVAFNSDDGNRRITLTLPNGVTMTPAETPIRAPRSFLRNWRFG